VKPVLAEVDADDVGLGRHLFLLLTAPFLERRGRPSHYAAVATDFTPEITL
jgi:hypothetical protein